MKSYLLDTNIVSHFLRGDTSVITKLTARPIGSVYISVITKAELLYGVAKRNNSPKLHQLVQGFLSHVETLPWSIDVAKAYAELRVMSEAQGVTIASMDLMIAAHAVSLNKILVSRDKAFQLIPANTGLRVEIW